MYTSKIISSDRDLLAVVFYGTEKDKNSVNFKNIYVLQDLDNPGAKRVLELDCFKGQQGKKHFRDTIGHGSDYSLSEVLWVCANLFSDVQFKMSHKRIMLFTNEDDPHGNDSAKASRARTKASDLRDTGGHFPYHCFKDVLFILFCMYACACMHLCRRVHLGACGGQKRYPVPVLVLELQMVVSGHVGAGN